MLSTVQFPLIVNFSCIYPLGSLNFCLLSYLYGGGGREEGTVKKIIEKIIFNSPLPHFFKLVWSGVGYCKFCAVLTRKVGKEGNQQLESSSCVRCCTRLSECLILSSPQPGRSVFHPFTDRTVKLRTPKQPLLSPHKTCFKEAVTLLPLLTS